MKKHILLLTFLLINFALCGQNLYPQKTVFLNKRNFVFFLLPAPLSTVTFDFEGTDVEFKKLTNTSFGLRFAEAYQVPESGVGAMVVLKEKNGEAFQPIWLMYKDTLTTTAVTFTDVAPPSAPKQQQAADTTPAADSVIAARNMALPVNIRKNCEWLLKQPRNIFSVGNSKDKVEASLLAIGASAEHTYLVFDSYNSSNVDYNIDYSGIKVETSKGAKVSSVKNLSYIYNEADLIKSHSGLKYVLVYDLFTLKTEQKIIYVFKEKNGGRAIELKIDKNFLIDNAYLIK